MLAIVTRHYRHYIDRIPGYLRLCVCLVGFDCRQTGQSIQKSLHLSVLSIYSIYTPVPNKALGDECLTSSETL